MDKVLGIENNGQVKYIRDTIIEMLNTTNKDNFEVYFNERFNSEDCPVVRMYNMTRIEHESYLQTHPQLIFTMFFNDFPISLNRTKKGDYIYNKFSEGVCYNILDLLREGWINYEQHFSILPIPLSPRRWNTLHKRGYNMKSVSFIDGYLMWPLTKRDVQVILKNKLDAEFICSSKDGCHVGSLANIQSLTKTLLTLFDKSPSERFTDQIKQHLLNSIDVNQTNAIFIHLTEDDEPYHEEFLTEEDIIHEETIHIINVEQPKEESRPQSPELTQKETEHPVQTIISPSTIATPPYSPPEYPYASAPSAPQSEGLGLVLERMKESLDDPNIKNELDNMENDQQKLQYLMNRFITSSGQ